jgi:hypothetical protein
MCDEQLMSLKRFLGILLAIVAWAAASLRPVEAATLVVTTTTDGLNNDGDCSRSGARRQYEHGGFQR